MIIFNKKKTIAALSALWVLLGIISALQVYFFQIFRDLNPVFTDIILVESAKFILWIIYIPFILYLLDKYSFTDKNNRLRNILFHFAAFLIFGIVHTVIFQLYLTVTSLAKITDIIEAFLKIIQMLFFNHLISYLTILAMGSAADYYKKYIEKESLSLKLEKLYSDAKLASLKAQLHPHFLFNVLNNVSMLVRQNKNSEAVKMITLLSEILRHILDNKDRNLITLEEEINLTQKYLIIESCRFEERLNYKLEIDPGLNNIKVPDLILQPLIENAFKHGLADKAADCKIIISAINKGDFITIAVEDNGCGMKDLRNPDNGGNGLKITSGRLIQTYGENSKIVIESEPELYTRVSFNIPNQL